jgi:YD repeat-containing protein
MAAADPSDVDVLLSMPTVAVDPTTIAVAPPGTGPSTPAAGMPQRSVTYNLDKAGNRSSVEDTGTTKSYSPNNLNQYTAVAGTTVSNGSEHELSSYQSISYTYINDERLQTVSSASNTYRLDYDALGRCVKRTVNGTINYYIYDGEKAILSYNTGGAIVAYNLYAKRDR